MKAQALRALVPGQHAAQSGEELFSTLGRLATERVWQEALEHEHAEAVGRGRYQARGEQTGDRTGYEPGTRNTAAGVLGVKLPQLRGRAEPSRAPRWRQVATPREVLKRLIVER